MAWGNPTQTQIDNTPNIQSGDVRVNRGQDGYLFASGLLEPEHSDLLSYLFPQYLATSIIDRIGRYEGIEQDVWSWNEMDRTRRGASIVNGGGTSGATITLETSIPSAESYFLVNDTVVTEQSVVARITAIGTANNNQTITIARTDGANWVIGDTANSENIGHLASVFGEYSDAPGTRVYLPNERYNVLQTIRRSCSASGKVMTSRTYLGGAWYYENQMIEMDELAKDRENTVMFSQISAVGEDNQTCEGIVPAVTRGGVVSNYTGSVTETDIQDHITAMRISSPANEYMVFCGADFAHDAQIALKDYSLNGGVDYGSFKGADMVGLNVSGYQFNDTTIFFVYYPTFNDTATLPYSGTATSTKRNYSNYSLWLNLGSDKGQNLISLKYKEFDGKQRKFILKDEEGMMGDGPKVANALDGNKTHMLSEIAPEVRCLNQHGILAATGV